MKNIHISKKNLGVIYSNSTLGFSNVPDQIRERSILEGFEINLLVMGRRGLGSSTLVNSLFGAPIVSKKRSNNLTVTKNEIIENNISLEATIITYHNENIIPLTEYMESLNSSYFELEQGPYSIYRDNRIHVCLYILPSDNLTDREINNMKLLSKKCNFIPIISKADMYTPEELKCRKDIVINMMREHEIDCFVPTPIEKDEEHLDDVSDIIENLPFSVIASETVYELDGDIIRGRKYPWGFINIEVEEGNDFKRLQKLLIHSHLDELINRTDTIYYNAFRQRILEIERNSESIQMTRYNKLKDEMVKILREKFNDKIEKLKKEEEEMERTYLDKMEGSISSINIKTDDNIII